MFPPLPSNIRPQKSSPVPLVLYWSGLHSRVYKSEGQSLPFIACERMTNQENRFCNILHCSGNKWLSLISFIDFFYWSCRSGKLFILRERFLSRHARLADVSREFYAWREDIEMHVQSLGTSNRARLSTWGFCSTSLSVHYLHLQRICWELSSSLKGFIKMVSFADLPVLVREFAFPTYVMISISRGRTSFVFVTPWFTIFVACKS